MMGNEYKFVSSVEVTGDFPKSEKLDQDNKYKYQVGLKDLDFDLDYERIKVMGLRMPFQGISQAEHALKNQAIYSNKLTENDNTEHQVLIFDHRTVGYSGFMNCVIHSLVLTNQGLFEVGRYPAMGLSTEGRYWQWFLHRRLATVEDINEWCEHQSISSEQFMQNAYQALTQEGNPASHLSISPCEDYET